MPGVVSDSSGDEAALTRGVADAVIAQHIRRTPKRDPIKGFGKEGERVGEVRADNMGERCSMLNCPKIST